MEELENNKDRIEQLFAEAKECFEKNEYDKAIEIFTKILAIDAENTAAYYGIGFANRVLGKYNEAIEDYGKVIELDANSSDAYNNIGYCHYLLGQYDEALKDYDKAIELESNQNNAKNYYGKGLVFHDLEQYDEALKDYDKAIELEPNQKYAYNNKVFTLKAKKNGDIEHNENIDADIISCYRLAIENNPLEKRYYDSLQSFYKDLGRTILANQVERDYYKAVQENADKNKKNTDKLQSQINELQKLTEIEKISEVHRRASEKSNEISSLIEGVEKSKGNIEEIESNIQARYKLLEKQYAHLENDALAGHYQTKADKLRLDLQGAFHPIGWFKKDISKKVETKNEPEKTCFKIGYTQSFWVMLLLDIGIIFAFSFLGFDKISKTDGYFWQNFVLQSMKFSPMFILLVWGTRYFNRRIHETVHLIEEYEHKAIVLRSFEPYSERIQKLHDPAILAKYTEKVSHIITDSPTTCLTRKKTDKLPIELIQALKSPVNLTIPDNKKSD